MGRKLPTFSALRAFEALARRGNLPSAATELCISSSAVSHQIKSLEAFLGTKLFVRKPQGLEITAAGRGYLDGITPALERIETETVRVVEDSHNRAVVINVYKTLAQFWLIPLLPEFLEAHPDVGIRIVSTPDEVDLTGAEVDVAIRYSHEPPPAFHVRELFAEFARPIAAPAYLARKPAIRCVADLARHCLIECTWFDDEWETWFAKLGETDPLLSHRFMCDTRGQALAAAAAGLGIALDRYPNGEEMISRGALKPIGDLGAPTEKSYFLIAPERSTTLGHVKAFCKWLEAHGLKLAPTSKRRHNAT